MNRLLPVLGVLALFLLAALPAEADVEPAAHPANACSAPYHVSGAGWDLCWQRDDPRAQGLELNQVYFRGQSVLWKIGTPFSITKYDANANGPFKDTLGNPGAGGHPGYGLGAMTLDPSDCPRHYGGTGTLIDAKKICVEERAGREPALAIWARYNIYNYRFMQGYMLDARGNVEPFIRMGGNLIDGNQVGELGANHFHHLIWRADFDIGAPGNDVAEVYRRAHDGPPASTIVNPLPSCDNTGVGFVAGWTPYPAEGRHVFDPCTAMKWRVKDTADRNTLGREKGFEFRPLSDATVNHFATMDIMVVQYKGDSAELGYNVPTNPLLGDTYLYSYHTPPEPVSDPVVWIFQHVYHDTRDEDRGSMTWHHSHSDLHPRNFHATNVGEPSYP